MREIRTSGSPSGDWKRSGYKSGYAGPPPRQSSTLPTCGVRIPILARFDALNRNSHSTGSALLESILFPARQRSESAAGTPSHSRLKPCQTYLS